MQIQQISVTGLFGIFDHVIPLNMADRITIIHGPNGFGKTAMLRLLNGFFNSQYSIFWDTPLSNYQIIFDNNSHIEIVKNFTFNDSDKRNREEQLTINLDDHNTGKNSFSIEKLKKYSTIDVSDNSFDDIPELRRISLTSWRHLDTGEMFSFDEVLSKFEDRLPNMRSQQEPEWLTTLKSNLNVRLIESQRLLNFVPTRSKIYAEVSTKLSTVSVYSDALVQIMRDKLTEYGVISQSLDRTFPTRLVQQQASPALTIEQIIERVNKIELTRSHLVEVGLLDKNEDSEFPFKPPAINDSTKNILSIYLEDIEKKLDIFYNLARKLELLRKTINNKFAYKEINFDKQKGFVFKPLYNSSLSDLETLSATDLSSGEQHELVLLYELLFKVEAKSLVLIDEPELSLHVGWQVNFLKDLQEVTKLADLDILMATHSPDIIQDRWDLTVELQGLKK